MKPFVLFAMLFMSISSICAQSSDEKKDVENVIRAVFESFSSSDIEQMKKVVTPDMTILEHGEVWNLDTVEMYFAKPRPADFKRVNHLDFFQNEIQGSMAFVSYFNTADIRANGRDRKIKWLESAVFVREKDSWKLKMLHSTRIENK